MRNVALLCAWIGLAMAQNPLAEPDPFVGTLGLSVAEGFRVPLMSDRQNFRMGPSRQNPGWDSGLQRRARTYTTREACRHPFSRGEGSRSPRSESE
jgi:hypothetical protein